MYVFVKRWPLLEFDELEVSPYDFQILTSIKGFYLVFFFSRVSYKMFRTQNSRNTKYSACLFPFWAKDKKGTLRCCSFSCCCWHFESPLLLLSSSLLILICCRHRCYYFLILLLVALVTSPPPSLLLFSRHHRHYILDQI